jgi:hypothetical protein
MDRVHEQHVGTGVGKAGKPELDIAQYPSTSVRDGVLSEENWRHVTPRHFISLPSDCFWTFSSN